MNKKLADIRGLIAIGISIGIALMLTYVLDGNGKVFFLFLIIGFGLMVYVNLIESWFMILALIFGLFIVIFEYKKGSVNLRWNIEWF